MAFAESARDAWSGQRLTPRTLARETVLTAASLFYRRRPTFTRCLYAHAVFPEYAHAFRQFVRHLKNIGDVIDTSSLLSIMRGEAEARGRYFHLSFDDGFANVFEVGCDILASEKVPATIFIATGMIEADYPTLQPYFARLGAYARPIRTMSWNQVREAADFGFEIGSHTCAHARLSDVSNDPEQLRQETAGARQTIESRLSRPCRSIAWPYGTMRDIDERSFAAIAAAGYEIAFSAVRGRVEPGRTGIHQVPRHQIEFHWPRRHQILWADGFREGGDA